LEVSAEFTSAVVFKTQEAYSFDMTHWYPFTILHCITEAPDLSRGWVPGPHS
jgi:hypothetical protein